MVFVRGIIVWILFSWVMMSVRGQEGLYGLSPCNFPAIYNFGDSNSDTGGMAAAFYPMASPSGNTFFHKPSGRGSDGRLIIDFIAKHLGLPYLSGYLDSVGTNFRHGANFATGGATIRHQNESWFLNGVSPFPLDIQTEHFNQFKSRTTDLYNQADVNECEKSRLPRPDEFSKALYTFDIGMNDIAAGYRAQMSYEEIRTTIPDIVSQLGSAIQYLHGLGARTFWIHNTAPYGCLAVTMHRVSTNPQPGYLDQIGCVKEQNEISMEFNRQLKEKVVELRGKLPNASLAYVDVYAAKYGLIGNAKQEGFADPKTICCGYHENGIDIWCGNKANVNGSEIYAGSCKDPSSVISWDGVHYSEAANHWIANHIINGSLSDPPIPLTNACQCHI
ncbi:GDSL esterase/lipase [Tripterygium wilfordii]|uniref:GDSL esterase/lipase n=2 Tax=Tripterygium wilfordii TaxID=458696 RepID=A0A7J7D242_TRIWF|nr:GDSL esterase/lipase [Tripterygium wilfordii]